VENKFSDLQKKFQIMQKSKAGMTLYLMSDMQWSGAKY